MADSSYFPLDADETLGDAPSVGSRTARVRYSSALQEYGPPPLASVLDYYHDSEEVRFSLLRLCSFKFLFSELCAGCTKQPTCNNQKECGTLPFMRCVAHFSAPHLHFLHFYVFDKPAHASLVASRAIGAVSLSQAIVFLSHRRANPCVRILARFQFLCFRYIAFMQGQPVVDS
jgi:hypothetical protein